MAGQKEEAKSDKEFWGSNSLPSSSLGRLLPDNGDSSVRLSVDENNGQISMLSNPSLGHHAKTPAEDNGGILNRGSPQPTDSIQQEESEDQQGDLHKFAIKNEWQRAMSVCDKHPELVGTPLTTNGDTVLHIAVSANSFKFVQQLVNRRYIAPENLETPNNDGNTAFCVAAKSGNSELLKIMMGKNGNLPQIYGQDAMLPVHLAALSGDGESVRLLSSDDLLGKMNDNDIQRLFLVTISNDIFDVAIKLFEKHRDSLVRERADETLTALHILAQRPPKFYPVDSAGQGVKLFKEVWSAFECNIYKPSTALFGAIQSGSDGTAIFILEKDPLLLTKLKDSLGRIPLHYAALYRRESVLKYILGQKTVKDIIRAVDHDGNNVLHLAASYQSHEALSRLDTKMQGELAWFKELEEKVPHDLRTMKNSEGHTPRDVFYASHRELSKEVKETVKGIANSGMPVAALIATVAFAAALTVPGDDKKSAWFVVFILTNTVALFASSASVISFLSIFTSAWVIDNEFIISLTLTNLGLLLLRVSVVAMVLSFAAASFLIFGHIFQWVAYVVVSMGALPILLLLALQSKYVDLLLYFNRFSSYYSWFRYKLACVSK